MLLASLRNRSSFKDVRNGDINGTQLAPTHSDNDTSTDVEVAAKPRPQSAKSNRNTFQWSEKSALAARPLTPSGPLQSSVQRRFSLKRLRHASDPQLSARFRQDAVQSGSSSPSGAPAPIIGVTAPTWDITPDKPKRRLNPFSAKPQSFRSKSSNFVTLHGGPTASSTPSKSLFRSRKSTAGDSSVERSRSPSVSTFGVAHALHGDAIQSLSIPPSRVSASSVSDQVSEDPSRQRPTPASRTASSTSSAFFKLPRRKKKKQEASLFPLPVQLSPSNPAGSAPPTQNPTIFPVRPSSARTSLSNSSRASPGGPNLATRNSVSESATPPLLATTPDGLLAHPSAVTFPLTASPLTRHDSTTSAPVAKSPPAVHPAVGRTFRGRSGTTSSFNSRADDERAPTPFHESVGRSSMASTTLGRNSVAGLRSLTSRWRNASESQSPGVNSPGGFASSKDNSFALSKETLVIPDREEGETPGRYYSRLEEDMPKKSIALCLSKSTDPFHHDVLRSLMRTFKFYEEPMDISLRKFLWEIDLPGEAQQIDRVMSSFAERYHECNPHIFMGFDQAYLAAYSLIILHSDLFNKNNKRKMQRSEYQKNTGGHGIDEEILGYFYDNIQYTEFIAQNLDDDESERRSKKAKARKKVKKIKVATTEGGEKGRLDPYDFILDDRLKLEVLRPALKGTMNLDDSFSYLGSSALVDIRKVRSAFAHPGILQVISARSRPEAFSSPSTIDNPHEAHPGVVDIKVAKVGIIWRKDPKRKKGRSPWQKWGALLTQSQLYFFRNVAWVEDLIKQSEPHQKHGHRRSIVVFRPQIEEFKPDFSLRTAAVLALVDTTYDKHKYGFVLASYDGFYDETVLADTESEWNDWLAKINYASAFATANIAIHPTNALPNTSLLRADTSTSSHSAQSSIAADESAEAPAARQNHNARKEMMRTRINFTDNGLRDSLEKLNEHLKTARHLQILAPFPPKTRSDLLSFGARMAHRVRWSRFDMWRLRCHRDMLTADLEFESRPQETILVADPSSNKAASPKISAKSNALSRLNSKASAIINPQRSTKLAGGHSRTTAPSKLGTTQDADLATGIDQAFATPAETLSKVGTTNESPFKLPPLAMGSGAISVNSYDNDRPDSVATDDYIRNNSTVSEADLTQISEKPTTPTASVNGQEDPNSTEKRPSTAVEAEREQAFGSPNSRSNVRRSLHRTLRDSREIAGQQRSKRQKDSISTITLDDPGQLQEGETLPRGTGSFKVHGKKASVITLGSEWQGISAEERLRARKQAQSQDAKAEVSPVAEVEGERGERLGPVTSASDEAERLIDSAPIAEIDGGIVAYVQAPSSDSADSDDATDDQVEPNAALDSKVGAAALESETSNESSSADDEGEETIVENK